MSELEDSHSSSIDPELVNRAKADLSNAADATLPPTQAATDGFTVPEIEGYEIVKELGRGGMGVVYQARNKTLDRPVALKMILGGQFASQDQVQRFLHEANSVAKLDHPGIVPIYEIGQSLGNHFFAMKLIEGGSLEDAFEPFREDQSQAVQLVAQIAEAVNHAHQRGILHRDLKPANILIDQSGNPHITDLGLAKRIDDEDSLTKTGSVMGSPGFMAPEQAAGEADVTTAVDVYALGAILYWLIAGKPPIEGETHIDIVLKTISESPPNLATHRPDANFDLNLICQKALAKDPQQRYESAAEFAEDLDAWLNGTPISVKAPTTLDVVRLWFRRNARTAAISAGLGVLGGMMIGAVIFVLIVNGLLDSIQNSQAALGDAGETWVTQYFGWVRRLPKQLLVLLPPMIVFLTVAFGILTILFIRPKSREIGLVGAATAALFSGITAFGISFGWSPIIRFGVEDGKHDIQLISNAMWLSDPEERQLASEVLLQKYPGLRQIDQAKRGGLITGKILRDQTLGVPRGIWTGIATTLCLGMLPMFFVASFSSFIWNQGDRGFTFIGKAIEPGIYSALFFLLLTKCFTTQVGFFPGFWFQVFTVGGIGLAIYLALTDRPWYWRVLGFFVVNLCLFTNMYESENIRLPYRIAAKAKSLDELQRAAYYFEKRLAVDSQEQIHCQVAVIYAYLGQNEDYQRHCRVLLSEFEGAYRPDVAERLAKTCLLKPTGVPNPALIHQLAKNASGYRSWRHKEWLFACRALSEYRLKHFESATNWTRQAREAVDDPQKLAVELRRLCDAIDALAFRAMAKSLEETEASRRSWAEQAQQAIARARETEPQTLPFGNDWLDRTIAELLVREYESEQTESTSLQPDQGSEDAFK